MTWVTPGSKVKRCNDMGYKFALKLWIGNRLDPFAHREKIKPLFLNIDDRLGVLPLVSFANQKFIIGSQCNSAALAY